MYVHVHVSYMSSWVVLYSASMIVRKIRWHSKFPVVCLCQQWLSRPFTRLTCDTLYGISFAICRFRATAHVFLGVSQCPAMIHKRLVNIEVIAKLRQSLICMSICTVQCLSDLSCTCMLCKRLFLPVVTVVSCAVVDVCLARRASQLSDRCRLPRRHWRHDVATGLPLAGQRHH